ncbi:hypothetical protein QR680_016620 [Steinernema hermaphroditum]|uniref:Uncharacterized protein n=1 Tax=Steinernema hermaphroditum TaxID=289476 RepID=A0AA39HC48_9BILA|nr:hypothetical protein QR680_016620 [Steinernema hermaphroditum]
MNSICPNNKPADSSLTDEALQNSASGSMLSTIMNPLPQRPDIGALPKSNLVNRLRKFIPQLVEANSNISPSSSMDPVVLNGNDESESDSFSSGSDSEDEAAELPNVVIDVDILGLDGNVTPVGNDDDDQIEDELPLAFRGKRNETEVPVIDPSAESGGGGSVK